MFKGFHNFFRLKNLFFFFFLIFSLTVLFFSSVRAVSYQTPTGFVNDYAGIFSTEFKASLEDKLVNLEKNTGAEIAVVTVQSLEGVTVEEYAVKLFEKWKIGKKEADNGVLLLIALKERKVRIEVGYGLESYITDARAGDIIRQDITPDFKNGDYEAGTEKAVDSLIKYIANKDIAPTSKPASSGDGFPAVGILVFIFIFATYLASFLGRTREIWPGGAIGAFLGFVVGIFITTLAISIAIAVVAGLFGLLLDFLLSRNYKSRKIKNLPTDFWKSWGGFSSGGGSSGGGGFGGFGGGSSGGGGASGGW